MRVVFPGPLEQAPSSKNATTMSLRISLIVAHARILETRLPDFFWINKNRIHKLEQDLRLARRI
jgi:hypothetical protein